MQKRGFNHNRPPIGSLCFYCNEDATGFDHVIPYCICGENTELVPCCKECNCLLHSTLFKNAWEKKSFIARALQKRYNSTLKMKVESSEGMKGKLKGVIERELKLKALTLCRIEFALNNPIDRPAGFDAGMAEESLIDYMLLKRTHI